MRVSGLLETAIYVEDVAAAAEFYHQLFGFEPMTRLEHFYALDVSGKNVLLLFKKGACVQPQALPGGVIPPHDGSGPAHLAFSIPVEDLPAWEDRLAAAGVEIEGRVEWPQGGISIYFRDPDGHLLELITPGVWPIY